MHFAVKSISQAPSDHSREEVVMAYAHTDLVRTVYLVILVDFFALWILHAGFSFIMVLIVSGSLESINAILSSLFYFLKELRHA